MDDKMLKEAIILMSMKTKKKIVNYAIEELVKNFAGKRVKIMPLTFKK